MLRTIVFAKKWSNKGRNGRRGRGREMKREKKNDFYYKWNENASLTSLNNSRLLIYFSKISRKLLFENWSVGIHSDQIECGRICTKSNALYRAREFNRFIKMTKCIYIHLLPDFCFGYQNNVNTFAYRIYFILSI